MDKNWRQLVEDEARTWKGTPYVHKARIKGVGVDCGGIVYQCFSPLLPLPPFPSDYPQDWGMHKADHELYLSFIAPFVIEVKGPQQGRVALFLYGRNYSHAAICTAAGTFIHASGRSNHGAVIESKKSFFNDFQGSYPRPVKFFDVKEEYQ